MRNERRGAGKRPRGVRAPACSMRTEGSMSGHERCMIMYRRRTRSPRVWGRPKLVAFLKPCESDRQSQSGSASERSRRDSERAILRLLSVGMSEDTHKTMSYSRRDAQDKEITFKFAADATAEHPYASTGHGRGAYVCALPRPGRPSRLVPWPGEVVGVWNSMAQP